MGDEKKTPPTSLDSAKPQYNLATNNRTRTDENEKVILAFKSSKELLKELSESKKVGKPPKKKED